MTQPVAPNTTSPPDSMDRRTMLIGAGAAAAGVLGASAVRHWMQHREAVFVARNQRYDGTLVQTIRDGLEATGFDPKWVAGRNVLLKPNMVEPSRAAPQMTTHPAMVVAAAEVFLGYGAQVVVGEAPGHVRDTEMALVESGMVDALIDARIEFADLNYQETKFVANAGRYSRLQGLYFPRSICEADLVVSMPKLKTHHWMGMTAALKNMYGVLPGNRYGWPKNVLHHAGIPQTVFDINATLPRTITIVDGILCMEGDGPIMGSPKEMGLVLVGTNPTAVDATCARIMGLVPERITYLKMAGTRLGPIDERLIIERGERWKEVARPFEVLDRPHLRELQLGRPGELTS